MFVRFRQTPSRLEISIVETRRVDGKVRHEHVASLGSIEVPPSVADRVAFWRRVNDRFGKLSNRIDPATQGKMRGDLHARVPMVTADEQRALQLENAEADERFWASLHGMNQEQVDGHKALAVTVKGAIATGQAGAAAAAAKAEAARIRAERIRKGEDVAGGLGKPMTREEVEAILLANGFTKSGLHHAERLSALFTALEKIPGAKKDFWTAFHKYREAGELRIRRLAERDVLRKHGLRWGEGDDTSET